MLTEAATEQTLEIPFYRTYLSIPPVLSPIIGFAVMHSDVSFAPFNVTYSKSDYCQDVAQRFIANHNKLSPMPEGYSNNGCTSISINADWWDTVMTSPMVGFLIAAVVTWTFQQSSRYVLQATDSYKNSWVANKIADSIIFAKSKIVSTLPIQDTMYDHCKFVTICGVTSAGYGLIGASCLDKVHNTSDFTDIITTHAVGGALLPAAGVSLCWGYRAANYVTDKIRDAKGTQEVPLLNEQQQRSFSFGAGV